MQKVCPENAAEAAACKRVRVGIFDSGVGGLNVLGVCMRMLPDVLFYYYGDNIHAPYGSRIPAQIEGYVRAALRRFSRLNVQAVVLACNTATAVCAERMRREFAVPVVGMEPAIAPAARVCTNVLVLATPLTAHSARLGALLSRFPDCRFTVCALPGLAGAIERHFLRGEKLTLSDHLPAGNFDGVVLGCTHYAFFGQEISRFYAAPVFDGCRGTANRLTEILSATPGKQIFGQDDHQRPKHNPNKCFIKNCKKEGGKRIIFLGKRKNLNKKVFFANICFT